MWYSGKKIRALRGKKINIPTLVLSEIFFRNETKNQNPPPPFKLNGRSLTVSVLMQKIKLHVQEICAPITHIAYIRNMF